MLMIDGTLVTSEPILPNHVELLERTLSFARLPNASPSGPCVYVAQGEYAIVKTSHGYSIGSDSATTCVILVLITGDSIGCLHTDGHGNVRAWMRQWEERPTTGRCYETVRAYVVGGWGEPGRKVAKAVWTALAESQLKVELKEPIAP